MKSATDSQAEVMAVLERFNEAWSERDLEALVDLIAPDPDVVLYGTGADERRIGLDEICDHAEQSWSQTDSLFQEIGWHSITVQGDVAWVAADSVAHVETGGRAMRFPLRQTGVLVEREGDWFIAQWHASMGAPDLNED